MLRAAPRTVAVFALALAASAGAQNDPTRRQDLPRGAGPVRLGMTASEFTRISHVFPDCTKAQACGPHETRASAFIDTTPPGESGLPGIQQFTAFFIRDTLFAYVMRPPDAHLPTMRAYYTGIFGPPQRQDTTEDGLGAVIWESRLTQLAIHYVRNQQPRGPPPGTVLEVQVLDIKLGKEAEKDRGDRPWP